MSPDHAIALQPGNRDSVSKKRDLILITALPPIQSVALNTSLQLPCLSLLLQKLGMTVVTLQGADEVPFMKHGM